MLGEDAAASDFAGVDFEAWRDRAARARRGRGAAPRRPPLRTALVALVAETDAARDLGGEAQLAPRIEAEPAARALLRRVVDDWLARL